MTVDTKKLFDPALLTTSAVTYYTTPENTRTIIKKLTCTNTDTIARTVTIHLIPTGGSASATNKIVDVRPVARNETFEAFEAEGHILHAGDFIQALASTGAVISIQASGVEIV